MDDTQKTQLALYNTHGGEKKQIVRKENEEYKAKEVNNEFDDPELEKRIKK
jgi:hypothetical protein